MRGLYIFILKGDNMNNVTTVKDFMIEHPIIPGIVISSFFMSIGVYVGKQDGRLASYRRCNREFYKEHFVKFEENSDN